jgi:outer membrane protein assembly factor BamB
MSSSPPAKTPIWLPALAILLVTAFRPATAAVQEDWRQFRGPGGQGTANGKGLPSTWRSDPPQNLAWKTPLPGPGGSSPVTCGDWIFLTAYSGYAVPGSPAPGDIQALQRHVLGIHRAEGRIVWRKDIPATQPEEARVRDHGYASSTPAADDQQVYAFLGKSGVHAFRHDGQPTWHADVGSTTHGWGSASSPVLHKDLVLINAAVESESLVALHRSTGKEVWRAGGIKESWNTPILVPVPGGGSELVVAMLGKVLGLNPDTGARLWSCDTGIGWYMVPSLVHHDGIVYCIGGRTGGSLAVRTGGRGDVTGTHRLWTLNKGSNVPSPILHDGHLYWLHENLGIAYCAEAATGKLLKEERLADAGPFYASPVLADGRLFAINRQGRSIVLTASPGLEVLGRGDLRDRGSFDAAPTPDGNRLLIRSDRFLYCIAAPGK